MPNLGLNIWSLFSGIGGLEKGLEDAGLGRTYLQCEIGDYPRQVLAKHWPDVLRVNDVRQVTLRNFANGKFPPTEMPNIICGGFPCQPHSVAGRRKGAEDERHLWPEFARIIAAFNPEIVVAENVPGIRSNGALLEVLTDLTKLGYDAEWIRLGAAAVGAPHLRERIFIVAYPCGSGRPENSRGTLADERQDGRQQDKDHVSDSNGESGGAGNDPRPIIFTDAQRDRLPIDTKDTVWKFEPNIPRVAYGVPKRVDRLKCLGNAVVPQVAQFVGSCIYDAISKGDIRGW